jgi:D-ribulokinase
VHPGRDAPDPGADVQRRPRRRGGGRIAASAPPDSPARGAASSLAKLLHLAARLDPPGEALALHQADWVSGRLAGRFGTSDWNNALKLGYDPVALAWPPGWSGWTWAGEPASGRGTRHADRKPLAEVAALTGLPADLEVRAGTTDSTAAVIAAGAARIGDAVTCLGSTLVVKVLAQDPVARRRYGVYSHRFGDLWLVGGASNSGGAVLRRHFDDAEMAALTPELRPDEPTGLDYYPLPAPGERFPVQDPGLLPRMTPRPADDGRFFQGLLEGIAAIEARGYRLLADLGAPAPRRVLSIGGGAVNPAWTRIRERMLGVPVLAAAHQEAAYGAALLAARGAVR